MFYSKIEFQTHNGMNEDFDGKGQYGLITLLFPSQHLLPWLFCLHVFASPQGQPGEWSFLHPFSLLN